MTNAAVLRMSQRFASIFKAERSGRVHSVYKSTVNLQFGDELFSLHPYGMPLSPICAVINMSECDFSDILISPGGAAAVDRAALYIGNACIYRRADTELFDLRLCTTRMVLSPESILSGLRSLKCLINRPRCDYWDIIDNFASNLHRWLAGENPAAAPSAIVGLGSGLTPSGDDYLTGLLAAFAALERRSEFDAVASDICGALSRTNDISAAFLCEASRGCFSEPLLNALYSRSAIELRDNLTAVSKIGHSSGYDALLGLRTGLMMK